MRDPKLAHILVSIFKQKTVCNYAYDIDIFLLKQLIRFYNP